MATTIIDMSAWTGTHVSLDEDVATIKQLMIEAQKNEDKASDVEDACFYEGLVLAYKTVLDMLYQVNRDESGNVVIA